MGLYVILAPLGIRRRTGRQCLCIDSLPITSGGELARRIGFAVPISGIKTTGVVRCDQPRVLDLSARSARKVDTLPRPLMEEVLAKLAPIFG